jgi:hypothetical protein
MIVSLALKAFGQRSAEPAIAGERVARLNHSSNLNP